MQQPAPPGGRLLQLAKLGAEQALWTRVGAKIATSRLRPARSLPPEEPPTDVLRTAEQYRLAIAQCRRLGLPLHHDRVKNWDALGAIGTVLRTVGTDARVLDAGAARYSPVLPWLRLYGVRELVGNNVEFTRVRSHGPVRFEPGDITDTQYRDGWFDAITCMSVIEHGVPVDAFLSETARILRPGGLLVVSTDYDQDPPETAGKIAYGVPVHIFDPDEIRDLVRRADDRGLQLCGELALQHRERPTHWKRVGLDFTCVRLSFSRR